MSKDNQGVIFIASFSEQLIREKVMMEKPDCYRNDESDWDCPDCKAYYLLTKNAKTFPYPVTKEQDGKEIPESEFRFSCKMGGDCNCVSKPENNWHKIDLNCSKVIAIPIEPDTSLQPVKESAMGWLKKEGYPDVMPMTLDNLEIILNRYVAQLKSTTKPLK